MSIDTPAKRRGRHTWRSQFTVAGLLVGFALALAAQFGDPNSKTVSALYLAGALVIIVAGVGELVHGIKRCGACTEKSRRSSAEHAAQRTTYLEWTHRITSKNWWTVIIAVLLVLVIVRVIHRFVPVSIAALGLLFVVMVSYAGLQAIHRPLMPWCPWCTDTDGGSDKEFGPALPPDPSAGRTR